MADNIVLKTYKGGNVTPQDDAIIYETAVPGSGMVRVAIPDLNIRRGPGTSFQKTGKFTGVGIFTIVEESDGWGLLKAYEEKRDGWISLAFTTRI